MSEPPRDGQLIALIGSDQPDEYLFDGKPGVVIDVGPTRNDVTVALASGPSLGVPDAHLAVIDIDEFRRRAARMRDGRHPTRHGLITPLEAGDPIDGPADVPPGLLR